MTETETPSMKLLEDVLQDVKDGKYNAHAAVVLLISPDSSQGCYMVTNASVADAAFHCLTVAGQSIKLMDDRIATLEDCFNVKKDLRFRSANDDNKNNDN